MAIKDCCFCSKIKELISALANSDFIEDLEALSSKNYLKSITKAREDFKKGRYYTSEQVFGKK